MITYQLKLIIKSLKDESELVERFNNIVKSTTGEHPTKFGILASKVSEKENVTTIIDKFKIIRAS